MNNGQHRIFLRFGDSKASRAAVCTVVLDGVALVVIIMVVWFGRIALHLTFSLSWWSVLQARHSGVGIKNLDVVIVVISSSSSVSSCGMSSIGSFLIMSHSWNGCQRSPKSTRWRCCSNAVELFWKLSLRISWLRCTIRCRNSFCFLLPFGLLWYICTFGKKILWKRVV